MYIDQYCMHGVSLRLTTDSAAIARAVQTVMRHFQQPLFGDPPACEFFFWGVPDQAAIPLRLSPTAQMFCSHRGQIAGDLPQGDWKCDLYRDHACQVADFHDLGFLRIDYCQRRAEGYLVKPESMHSDILASFFHFALTELGKHQGLYTLHAAALEKAGRGLLIPGYSGQGKTTCCIALLRAGYRFLADDHPLLRNNGARLELLSFPEKIDVTEQTLDFFPELREAEAWLHHGVYKRYFHVHDFYPNALIDTCKPAVIILPHIIDWPTSHLEPLPKSRALEELLPQGLLVFDKAVAKQQFQTLSRLVEQTACYRLHFGEDILELPCLIDSLLEKC